MGGEDIAGNTLRRVVGREVLDSFGPYQRNYVRHNLFSLIEPKQERLKYCSTQALEPEQDGNSSAKTE